MTVPEAAAKFGVSTQAIYQQLKKLNGAGKNSKTGQITQEGMLLLESVYQSKEQAAKKVAQADLLVANETIDKLSGEIDKYKLQVSAMQDEINALNNQLEAQKQAAEVLSVKLEAATEKANGLEVDKVYLMEQLNKAIVPALPAPDPEGKKKRGFFGFFSRK